MRDTARFANRVLSVATVSKMPAGLWSKLCKEVIEPVLEDLSKNSRKVTVDGECCDAYSDHMPIGESDDEFATKITAELALELYRVQREYNHVANTYERALQDPPVEMPEEIAQRLTEGVSQVEVLNRFLVIADAFVEIADDFRSKGVNTAYIMGLLRVALDVYAHYLLLAPLDIDSSISVCGGMIPHCVEQRKKVQQICDEINGIKPADEDELVGESEPEEESEEIEATEESFAEEPVEAVEEPTEEESEGEASEEPTEEESEGEASEEPTEEESEGEASEEPTKAVEEPTETVDESQEEPEEQPMENSDEDTQSELIPDDAHGATVLTNEDTNTELGDDDFKFVNDPAETSTIEFK